MAQSMEQEDCRTVLVLQNEVANLKCNMKRMEDSYTAWINKLETSISNNNNEIGKIKDDLNRITVDATKQFGDLVAAYKALKTSNKLKNTMNGISGSLLGAIATGLIYLVSQVSK